MRDDNAVHPTLWHPRCRRALVLVVGSLVLLSACSTDSGRDPIPTSAPVLTTAPSEFTTTTTTLAPGPKLYEIQAGDTLSGVAEEYGISLHQLLQANPKITDAGLISIGDIIVIPDIPDPAAQPGLEVPEPTQPDLPALTSSTTTTEPNVTTSTAGG